MNKRFFSLRFFLLLIPFLFACNRFTSPHLPPAPPPAPSQKPISAECEAKKGILVLAHGTMGHNHGEAHNFYQSTTAPSTPGEEEWENTVLQVVSEAIEQIPYPVEVAFGMWEQKNFQEATIQLAHQDVCDLIVIPFFISDHSDVIRAQHYQFHLTEKNPLPFDPGRVQIPESIQRVTFRSALNSHPYISQILEARAQKISHAPQKEELILVAHGPNGDEDDLKWLQDLDLHASRIKIDFAQIHTATLRDDAPTPIRDQKTQELRQLVTAALQKKHTPIIVPVLLAPGGIEAGLHERLQGLDYNHSQQMLAPDPLLVKWIIEQSAP